MLCHLWKNPTKLKDIATQLDGKMVLEVEISYDMQNYVVYVQDFHERS